MQDSCTKQFLHKALQGSYIRSVKFIVCTVQDSCIQYARWLHTRFCIWRARSCRQSSMIPNAVLSRTCLLDVGYWMLLCAFFFIQVCQRWRRTNTSPHNTKYFLSIFNMKREHLTEYSKNRSRYFDLYSLTTTRHHYCKQSLKDFKNPSLIAKHSFSAIEYHTFMETIDMQARRL